MCSVVEDFFMLGELRAEVCQANLDLARKGLVLETRGNASGIDRELGFIIIKTAKRS